MSITNLVVDGSGQPDLQMGGLDKDMEADKISFRNTITGDDDKPKIQ